MRSFSSRERIAWTIVTAVLLAGLAFFALSPRLLAGSTEDETQAYLSTLGQSSAKSATPTWMPTRPARRHCTRGR